MSRLRKWGKIRVGLWDHLGENGFDMLPALIFIEALCFHDPKGLVQLSREAIARRWGVSRRSVSRAMNWLMTHPNRSNAYISIARMEPNAPWLYSVAKAEWGGKPAELDLTPERGLDTTDQALVSRGDTTARVDQNPTLSEVRKRVVLRTAASDQIIERWNEVATAKNWRRSKGYEADREKVNAAIKRKEFADNWREMCDRLQRGGLPFMTRPDWRSSWKPNLEWFCRKGTTQKVMESQYWGGSEPTEQKPQKLQGACECGADVWTGKKCPVCGKAMTHERASAHPA